MPNAKKDGNRVSSVLGLSNADQETLLMPFIDANTNRWLVSAITDIGLTEGEAYQSGDTGVLFLGVRQDTQSDFASDGDYVPFSVNENGELRVTGGGGGTQYSEGSTSATITGTAIMWEDTSNTLRPVSTSKALPVNMLLGTTSVSTNTGNADSGTIRMVLATDQPSIEVENNGTFVVQVDGSALTALQSIDSDTTAIISHVDGIEALLATIDADTSIISDWDNGAGNGARISGDVAHDSADSGEPVKIGGKAINSFPSSVATGDRVNALFDTVGRQIVQPVAPRELLNIQATTISNTSETTIATAEASTFLDLIFLLVTNTSDTPTEITIKDSTTGTTRMVLSAPAGDTRGISFPVPLVQNTANNNWTATASDAVTSLQITSYFVRNK
jgi:hypothetical protein